jgi:hypothetical protein
MIKDCTTYMFDFETCHIDEDVLIVDINHQIVKPMYLGSAHYIRSYKALCRVNTHLIEYPKC